MTSKLILIAVIGVLFWGCCYAWLKSRFKGGDGKSQGYVDWIRTSLDDMFIVKQEKQILRALLVLTLVGGIIGFLLPGKLSQVDQRITINKGVRLNAKGQYVEASLVLDSIQKFPSPLAHNELGVAYLGQNNFIRAEKEFQQAVRLLPHYGKAHQNLALLYTTVGRFTEAAFEESRAIESEKFVLDEGRIYNLSDNLMEQLKIRLVVAFFMAFLGYKLPKPAILFLKWRRRTKFDEQLSDGLMMVANSLRAGLSLVQAVEMVSKEAKVPLNQEFELILREQRLGLSLDEAFAHIAVRMPGKDTKIMVNAVLILLSSGGNLPERFESLSKTIQERKRIQKKIKSMTAEGETQAWILSVLPLVLALVMNSMNAEAFSLLYTTALGWMIIALMVLLESLGIFFMVKATKVSV
ncbi:MAG: type II secretion system F family protein [Pseudomonadota bacterium]